MKNDGENSTIKWSHKQLSDVSEELLSSIWNKQLLPELELSSHQQRQLQDMQEVRDLAGRGDLLASIPPVVAVHAQLSHLLDPEAEIDDAQLTPPVGPDGYWHAPSATTWNDRGAAKNMGELAASIPGQGRGSILNTRSHPHLEPPLASTINDKSMRVYGLYDLARTSSVLRWLVDLSDPLFRAIVAANTSATDHKSLLDSLIKGDPRRAAAAAAAPASVEPPRPLPFAPNPAMQIPVPTEIPGEFDEVGMSNAETLEYSALENSFFVASHVSFVNDATAYTNAMVGAHSEEAKLRPDEIDTPEQAEWNELNLFADSPPESPENLTEEEKASYEQELADRQELEQLLANPDPQPPKSAEEWAKIQRLSSVILGSDPTTDADFLPDGELPDNEEDLKRALRDTDAERQISMDAAEVLGHSREYELYVTPPPVELARLHRGRGRRPGREQRAIGGGSGLGDDEDLDVDDDEDLDEDLDEIDKSLLPQTPQIPQPDPEDELLSETNERPNLEGIVTALDRLAYTYQEDQDEFSSIDQDDLSKLEKIAEVCADDMESMTGGVISKGIRYVGEATNDPADIEAIFGTDDAAYGESSEPLPVPNAEFYAIPPRKPDENAYQDLGAPTGLNAYLGDDDEVPLPSYPERELRAISETLADMRSPRPKMARVNIGTHTVRYPRDQLF